MPQTVSPAAAKKKTQLEQARRDLKGAKNPLEREVIGKRIDRLLEEYLALIR